MGKAGADHAGFLGRDSDALRPVDALEYFFRHDVLRRAFSEDTAVMEDCGLIAEPEYVVRGVAPDKHGNPLRGNFAEYAPHRKLIAEVQRASGLVAKQIIGIRG